LAARGRRLGLASGVVGTQTPNTMVFKAGPKTSPQMRGPGSGPQLFGQAFRLVSAPTISMICTVGSIANPVSAIRSHLAFEVASSWLALAVC
jgi:hypothetical protein